MGMMDGLSRRGFLRLGLGMMAGVGLLSAAPSVVGQQS